MRTINSGSVTAAASQRRRQNRCTFGNRKSLGPPASAQTTVTRENGDLGGASDVGKCYVQPYAVP